MRKGSWYRTVALADFCIGESGIWFYALMWERRALSSGGKTAQQSGFPFFVHIV